MDSELANGGKSDSVPDHDDNHELEGLRAPTTVSSFEGPQDLERVALSEDERRRFSALVQWSYADEWFAAEPHIDQDCATLVLRGEIDAIALPDVRSLLELIVDVRPLQLHIDLADAAFVSVSAMLCMVDAARHISNVVIDRPSATVRRIFELVDADRRLAIAEEI